jgi:hypothetical protein
MLSAWIPAVLSGLIAGLLLGALDALALVRARDMFFTVSELLSTAAWTMGIALMTGTLVSTAVWALRGALQKLFEGLGVGGKTLVPAALVAAVVTGPAGMLFLELTRGPQASRMSGRLFLVWAGGAAAAAMVGLGIVLVPRWAEQGRRSRIVVAVSTIMAVIALHVADAALLVRLYPVFHAAMTGAAYALGGFGFSVAVPRLDRRKLMKGTAAAAALAIVFGALSLYEVLGTQNARYVIHQTTAHAAEIVTLARAVVPQDRDRFLDEAPRAIDVPSTAFDSSQSLVLPGSDLILITIDAMRYDRLALLGAKRAVVPNLDALAGRAVVFSRAYTPVPHTSYAITSLLTGKFTKGLYGVPGAPRMHETWPTILRRFRYKSSAFFTPAVFFIDRERFRPYLQSGVGFGYRKADSRLTAEARVDQMIAHLRAVQDSGHPHFAWAHFFEAHEPYDPACTHFGEAPMDRYDCEVWTVDKALGRLFDYLEKERPDAILIVTADHGEEFGDHGGKYHGTTLYDEQVRVPLVMRIPGTTHRIIEQPVSLVDLLGTSLRLLDIPVPARVRSQNLVPLIAGEAVETEAFSEVHDEIMVVRGGYKAACDTRTDLCRLYDLAADPGERRSVAEQQPEVLEGLKQRIHAWRRSHAEVELRPVITDRGLEKWPLAIEKALAGDEGVAGDLLNIIESNGADRIRQKAAELLFRLSENSKEAIAVLPASAGKDERDPVVAAWIASIRASSGDPEAVAFLARSADGLETGSAVHRTVSLTRLEHGDAGAVPDVLSAALRELTPMEERRRAIQLLAKAGARPVAKDLVSLINTYQLSLETIRALAVLKERSAFDAIVARLKRERFAERKASIIESLVILNDPRGVAPIAEELFNETPPPGALAALAAFVKPTRRGRPVPTGDRKRHLVLFDVNGAASLAASLPAVDRVVAVTSVRSEGAMLEVACGGETRTVPLSASTGQGCADLDACRTAGPGKISVGLSVTPEDLGAEIRFAAVLGTEAQRPPQGH